MRVLDQIFIAGSACLVLATAGWAQSEPSRSEALAALAAIELDQSRPGVLSFDSTRYDAGSVILSNVVIYNTGADEIELDAKGQPLDDNPYLGADLHIEELRLEGPRLSSDESLLLDGLVMSGFALQGHESSAVLSLETIRVDAPSPDLAAVIGEALQAPSVGGDDAEFEGDEVSAREVVFSGFVMEGVDAEGTDVRMRIEDTRLTYDADTAASGFVLRDWRVDTVTAQSGTLAFNVAEVRLDGIDIDTIGGWGEFIDQDDQAGFIEAYFQTLMLQPGELYQVLNIRDVSLSISGVELALDALTVSNQVNGALTRSRTRLNGLSLVPDAEHEEGATVAASLTQMGYDQITLQAEFNTNYDAENGRVWTEGENFYRLEDGFRLDVASDTSGYDRLSQVMAVAAEADRDDEAVAQAIGQDVLSAVRINELSLTLTDESLLPRFFTRMSEEQQMPVEDARSQMAGAAGLMALGMTQSLGPDLGMQVNRALTSFIQEGGSLTVRVAPDGTPTVMDMLTPDAKTGGLNVRAMGLSVTHTPPSD